MNQKSHNQGTHPALSVLGGLAILAGVLFLVGNLLNLQIGTNVWTLLIVGAGVALFAIALLVDKELGPALAIVSGLTTMSGLILLGQTMMGTWATWAYSWTLIFPTSMGLGLLAYGALKQKPDLRASGWSLTKVGLALFLVFFAFFEGILAVSGFGLALAFGWPLLFISLGLLVFALMGLNLQPLNAQ